MRNRYSYSLIVFIVFISLVSSFSLALASCQVENIDSDKCFPTIQEAIDDTDTKGGHTIEVSGGNYEENVVVHKSVTLKGPNSDINPTDDDLTRNPEAEITPTTTSDPTIIVKADDVTISGFKLNGDNLSADDGILVEWGDYSNIAIEDNIVVGYKEYPVRLQSVSGAQIENNLIKDNGVVYRNSDGSEYVEDFGGIRVDNSSDITISGNKIIENGLTAIQLVGTDNAHITKNVAKENHISPCYDTFKEAIETDENYCHLEGSGVDISRTDGGEVLVERNQLSHNDRGSVIGDVSNVEIRNNNYNHNLLHGIHILSSTVSFHDNDVIGNGRFGGVGIIGGSGNRVFDNDINNNDSSGIGVSGHGRWGTTRGNELISNDVIGNRWGISIGGSSHGNKVEGNIIKENQSGIGLHGYTVDEETTNPQNASIAYTRSLAQNVKPQGNSLKAMNDTNDEDTNYFPSDNKVIDNILSRNNTGINLGNAPNNAVKSNTISEGKRGIALRNDVSDTVIFGNTISHVVHHGIALNGVSNVIVEENEVSETNEGIRVVAQYNTEGENSQSATQSEPTNRSSANSVKEKRDDKDIRTKSTKDDGYLPFEPIPRDNLLPFVTEEKSSSPKPSMAETGNDNTTADQNQIIPSENNDIISNTVEDSVMGISFQHADNNILDSTRKCNFDLEKRGKPR